MKIKHFATAITAALLTVGLVPAGSAQDNFDGAPQGIEVITVVGKRPTQEGIEVITVVGKRPAPTVASTCVNTVMAARASDNAEASDNFNTANAQAPESRHADIVGMRMAIKDCIQQAQAATSQS